VEGQIFTIHCRMGVLTLDALNKKEKAKAIELENKEKAKSAESDW